MKIGVITPAALVATVVYGQSIDIPYQKFALKNGLTVIVHEDRKAPIVAVNVWYHVGSKNEKKGKTGFAHLFEHLMFNGSEHFNQDYFKVLEKLGATDLNGTTNEDRTNYFQNVPTSALDTVLWMESDRMGHMLGAVNQAKLDEQRGVVQNEKRQGENEPYGQVDNLVVEASFPPGHPYSWTVIGSMEDLNAAKLEDVHEWFKSYYGPNNAVIVLAGDIDVKTAREKVEKYFGAIAPGPPVAKHREWISKRSGEHRQTMQDRVPQARVYMVWNIPPAFTKESDLLSVAANVLSSGKNSRLHKRLVLDDQIATDVFAAIDAREIASQFFIQATARPGGDLAKVERAVREEIARLLKDGPTAEELERVKTKYLANFVRGIERIGGFGGKSDQLARGEVFTGNPEAYKREMENRQKATAEEVRDIAKKWLSDGVYVLEVHPFPSNLSAAPKDTDRSKVPEPGPPPALRLPKLERKTLSNGMKVVLAQRHEIPVVNFQLRVDAGYAADQFGKPGTAKLAMAMLDEGAGKRTALQISDEMERLGANLGTGAGVDACTVYLSALKRNLDASLDIFADVILRPSFPDTDFRREQKQMLAAIQREKVQPFSVGIRLMPVLLFGKGHAYGMPLTGSGTEDSVQSITREDLAKFHQTWFKPNNATLIVAGDATLDEIVPKIEKLFAMWQKGEVPKKNVGNVSHRDKPVVYLLDRPGSMQSTILAGHIAPPKADPQEVMLDVFNSVIGGGFMSRINMNLREDKHWSYGAGAYIVGTKGQRPYLVAAPVQTDKTKESMAEVLKELKEVQQQRPVTEEELARVQDQETLSMPGSRETVNGVIGSIADIIEHNLPDNYYETLPARIRGLTVQDMKTAAERLLHPNKMVWVVVGDRAKIEKGIRELNFGELKLVDADGNPVL